MAEYITKEQVAEWFRAYGHWDEGIPYDTLVDDIVDMPAADVLTPVRCGECRKFIRDTGLATGKDVGLCDGKMLGLVRLTDYCSFGELLCNGDEKD